MQKQGIFNVFSSASNSGCIRVYNQSNYYCFGSPMPGRTYSASGVGKYRYGFNGKEKDDEINVDGGSYDFGARIYDGRLGRWLSLDPLWNDYPSHSNYSYAANNPIIIIDIGGEFLQLGGQIDKAKDDIQSLIKNPSYRDVIQVDAKTGIVSFDMSKAKGLTEDIINNDPGLWLLKSIVGSDQKYLYESVDKTKVTNPLTKKEIQINTALTPDNVYSKTMKYYEDRDIKNDAEFYECHFSLKPKEGYDGQVAIHPDMVPLDNQNNKDFKERTGVIFHALAEVYARTEPMPSKDIWGMPYALNSGEYSGGAHAWAINLANGLLGGTSDYLAKGLVGTSKFYSGDNPGQVSKWKIKEITYDAAGPTDE